VSGAKRVKDLRLLVVEDEGRIAQFLKKGLSERGYCVVAVGDGDGDAPSGVSITESAREGKAPREPER